MTISVFEMFMESVPAVRAHNMMDMAQAALYAQVTNDSRRQIWQGWSQIVNKVIHAITIKDTPKELLEKSLIMWNGEPRDIKFLKNMFAKMFGRRSVER